VAQGFIELYVFGLPAAAEKGSQDAAFCSLGRMRGRRAPSAFRLWPCCLAKRGKKVSILAVEHPREKKRKRGRGHRRRLDFFFCRLCAVLEGGGGKKSLKVQSDFFII